MQAWQRIEGTRHQPIHRMKVIENGTSASLLLERSNPKDVMGYIVENDLVVDSLTKSVEKAIAESGSEHRPGCIDVLYDSVVGGYKLPKSFTETDLPELSIKRRNTDEMTTITTSLLVNLFHFVNPHRLFS